jgi:hypothetical protein
MGEFFPLGQFISLGSFMKISVAAQTFGILSSVIKVTYLFWQKVSWATIWAISSPTHQVTLL